ncbi:MAG: ABC transporter substrate-binding protein [Clostridia bacterium]|nr:ABC transporter substrate-binding protein [Clostridia bacterium]
MKKTVLKVLALCMSLFCIAGCFVACGKKHDDAIVIGLSGPTTEAAATYGLAVQNSAQMAVDEINAAGGLKNGVKLYLAAYDDKHDPTLVANNYAAMDKEGMQVALGCVTTNPCLEFVKLSNDNDIFFLTPSASGNAVVTTGDHAYQMCFADDNQGEVVAKIVNDLAKDGKLGKLGVLYKSGDPYSEGIYNRFKATLDSSITYVYASFEGDDNTVDLAAQVTKLQDCDFIFMPIYYTPAAKFMTAAKGKVANDAIYYGCDGFDGIDTSVEGFDITTIPQEVIMLSHFDSKATDGLAGDYIKKYKEAYPDGPLNQFGAAAYDCIYALAAAMNQAIDEGKEITADIAAKELCDILTEQFKKGFPFSGATGENITWGNAEDAGYVQKAAQPITIKKANA